ncbi:hypothetical protein ACQPYA_21270 [Micromonospora sp. CA-263727]|uniref:hypothetical protein n=1 Tax=Micromonospora sp. CA-263727 TaxID=3239967 RepID=UPI003D8C8637
MSENGNDQSRLRIGGWIPGHGRPGPGPAQPAAEQSGTGAQQYRPVRLLRRTTPSPPLAPIGLPSPAGQTGTSRDAGPATGPDLATGKPSAVGRLFGGTAPHGSTPHRGAATGRADARRKLLIGGATLVAVTTLVGVTALHDRTAPVPVRGEFVAAVPHPAGPADSAANGGSPPGADGAASGDDAAPHGPVGDPVVRPGITPRADGSHAGNGGSSPAAPGAAPAHPATDAPPPPRVPPRLPLPRRPPPLPPR